MGKTSRFTKNRMVKRKGPPAGMSTYPIKPQGRERCPECGATESCYACVTSGGWIDPKREAEIERQQDEEISP